MLSPAMQKAYSYIRFSTPEQAKGNSLARQTKLSDEYAAKHGLKIDTSFTLQDLGLSGFSGKNIKKGALGAFLKAVEIGQVQPGSVLLVESLDRISRAEITEQMTLFMRLINSGIEIVTLTDGMRFSRASINDNFTGLMYSLMIMSRGHEESATKGKRVRAAWQSKRDSGKALTALCPAWLRLRADRSGYDVIPERAEVLKRIFEMADNGRGNKLIAKLFNQEGLPVWGRGNGWHSSYVQKILQSRSVLGEYQHHKMQEGKRVPIGGPAKGYFPAVVDEELFVRVNAKQRELGKRNPIGRKSATVSNLFTGLLKKVELNGPGGSVVYVNKGKTWQYLVPDEARRGVSGTYTSWPYEHFETAFLTFLDELDFSELFSEKWGLEQREKSTALAKAKASFDTTKAHIKRFTDALSESDVPVKAIVARLKDLEDEQERQEAVIAQLEESMSEQLEQARTAKDKEAELKELMKRRGEIEARFKISAMIREQVELIEMNFRKTGNRSFRVLFKTGADKYVEVDREDPTRLVYMVAQEGVGKDYVETFPSGTEPTEKVYRAL